MDFCRSCGKCCFETEMLLSKTDIERIEALPHKRVTGSKFYLHDGDDFLLRNIEGHCIFLVVENNTCQIYEDRPQGCRFYPLIYDLDKDQCVKDEDCPYRHKFYKKKPLLQKTCRELKNWVHSELLSNDG